MAYIHLTPRAEAEQPGEEPIHEPAAEPAPAGEPGETPADAPTVEAEPVDPAEPSTAGDGAPVTIVEDGDA